MLAVHHERLESLMSALGYLPVYLAGAAALGAGLVSVVLIGAAATIAAERAAERVRCLFRR